MFKHIHVYYQYYIVVQQTGRIYIALKLTQKLNSTALQEEKTIVSLDLHLYSKCIQCQSNRETSGKLTFQMKELHIIFLLL